MGEFPAELFRLSGNPEAIRSSAQAWRSFGDAASGAADAITSLDTSEFIGPEADLFREKLNQSIPDHLRVTGDAYRTVAGALSKFAGVLSGLQEEMSPITHKAPQVWQEYEQKRAQQNQAQLAAVGDEALSWVGLSDGANTGQLAATSAAATVAERAWQDCVNAASGIRNRMTTAASECARCITEAAGTRFAENPSFFERIGTAIGDFLDDPIAALRFLSNALKVVSAVTGLLSLIPPLTPIMAPIALGTAGAALAIDAGLHIATGEGNTVDLLIDAGLIFLPGLGKVARPVINRASYELGAIRHGVQQVRQTLATQSAPVVSIDGTISISTDPLRIKESLEILKESRKGYVKEIIIDSKRYPESAAHIRDAQNGNIWRGDRSSPGEPKPDILTLHPDLNKENRTKALKGIDTLKTFDRDEYPPAMFKEGGEGASVKYISPSDNRGSGRYIRHRTTGLPIGALVRIVVE